jgi:ribose transport system ATP-binding protein
MTAGENLIEMRAISKSFSGTPVLRNVDFSVLKGEIHALVGGNGAGKSTLMKILQGVYQPDEGEILVGGRAVNMGSIQDARAAGIGMVFQEFSLVATLTVAQNIFLGVEPLQGMRLIDDREAVRRAATIFADMGVDLDPRTELSHLGTAYWQLTEIAKALAQEAKVLIMDEPTASLAQQETEALFALLARLKERGIAIVYISHRMDEVYRIGDRITILRDGTRFLTAAVSDTTPEQIVEGIVGRKIEGQLTYRERPGIAQESSPVLLEARDLVAGTRVRDVSFALRAGEIVGIAGLMGSGRTELLRALFGIDRLRRGEVQVRGKKIDLSKPKKAIAAGLALIPEDRRAQGLVLDHSVIDNLLLPLLDQIERGPFLDMRAGNTLAAALIAKFAIKTSRPQRAVRLLSGGNQQKVVLAKWLGTNPDVLLLDEPTAGVDIGTKSEILEQIRELANAGKGVIVVSSEYPELLAVSDRVLIMRAGAIVADLKRSEIADEESLQLIVQGVTE